MAKAYYKTVPEIKRCECEGCCAFSNSKLCDKLIVKLTDKTGRGCYDHRVVFKFVKRED